MGVVRSSSPTVAPLNASLFVTVQWDIGTDLYVTVDFGDGTDPFTWDFQVNAYMYRVYCDTTFVCPIRIKQAQAFKF